MKRPIDDFAEYIEHDVLGHLHGITTKKMFGGHSFYQNGTIFAVIIEEDAVCFKADTELIPEFEAAGAVQWVYTGHKKRKPTAMPYWQVPETVLEDKEKITDWARKSIDASLRIQNGA